MLLMRHKGKIIGFLLGLLFGVGIWGGVIGFILGALFDHSIKSKEFTSNKQRERQKLFFQTTFEVMGHLSKAKGKVTTADINIASHFMDQLGIMGAARQQAQAAFRLGKQEHYPLNDKIKQLAHLFFGRYDFLKLFLEIQLQVAFSDGQLHPNERRILLTIAQGLGLSQRQFESYLRMMEGSAHFNDGRYHQSSSQTFFNYDSTSTLENACKILGVSLNDEPTVIKRAYRKLMAEHHPDKLMAKGLPPEMLALAKKKTQEIQSAYEVIKRKKGFK